MAHTLCISGALSDIKFNFALLCSGFSKVKVATRKAAPGSAATTREEGGTSKSYLRCSVRKWGVRAQAELEGREGGSECGCEAARGRGQKWSCRLPIKTFSPAGHFPLSRSTRAGSHCASGQQRNAFEKYTSLQLVLR